MVTSQLYGPKTMKRIAFTLLFAMTGLAAAVPASAQYHHHCHRVWRHHHWEHVCR
jgi:hypothetical protein